MPRSVLAVVCVGLLVLLARAQTSDDCVGGPFTAVATVRTSLLCNGASTAVVVLNVTEGNDGSELTYFLTSSTVDLENDNGVFTGLAAGVYTPELMRASDNCTIELGPVTLTAPEALGFVMTPAPVMEQPTDCTASDGSITVSVAGGVAPYTVSLGSTSVKVAAGEAVAFEGLAAAVHNFTIVDANNCSAWHAFTLGCNDPNGFPAWAIAVIVVGGVLVLAAVAVFIVCCAYKRHQKRYRDVFKDAEEDSAVGVQQGDPDF